MKSWTAVAAGMAAAMIAAQGARADMRKGEGTMQYVESRIFEGVKYVGATRTLTLVFDSGAAYAFQEVPREVYLDFTRVVNKGEYFNRHIRRTYACRRLDAYPATWCARE